MTTVTKGKFLHMNAQIKQSCPADWEKMKIGFRSRHCEQCDKAVIDFTEMSREEMVRYLIENSDQRTCGRMRESQFDFHLDDMPVIIDSLSRKGGNIAFLMMALLCASLLSCSTPINVKPENGNNHVHGDMEMVMGKIAIDTNSSQSNNDRAVTAPAVEKAKEIQPGIEPERIFQGEVKIQPEPPKETYQEEEVLHYAEKMPEFPGGMSELQDYIKKNLKYPEIAKEMDIQGTIYVRFEVDKDGKITNPTILKSVPNGKSLDQETLRLIKSMPLWIPGEQNGSKVKVYFTMPVRFRLD